MIRVPRKRKVIDLHPSVHRATGVQARINGYEINTGVVINIKPSHPQVKTQTMPQFNLAALPIRNRVVAAGLNIKGPVPRVDPGLIVVIEQFPEFTLG